MRGRLADGSPGIGTKGGYAFIRRHRGCRAARRTAWGVTVPPRVVGRAVELRDAHVEAAELAGRCQPDGDGTATEQALDIGRQLHHRAGERIETVFTTLAGPQACQPEVP